MTRQSAVSQTNAFTLIVNNVDTSELVLKVMKTIDIWQID